MKKTAIGKLKLNKETLKVLTDREEAILKEVKGGATEGCATSSGFCYSSTCASNVTSPCEATTRFDTCICAQC